MIKLGHTDIVGGEGCEVCINNIWHSFDLDADHFLTTDGLQITTFDITNARNINTGRFVKFTDEQIEEMKEQFIKQHESDIIDELESSGSGWDCMDRNF